MSMVIERIVLHDIVLELERPHDPESLLSEDAFGDDEFLPYWAELWSSGRALASYLADQQLTGLRVLELGCGLGLPSLVAAARGARVLATDWSPTATTLLAANAARNSLDLEAREVDWRSPGSLSRDGLDLILAADVLYEERNSAPLLELLSTELVSGGEAWIADPGRRHAAAFLDAAEARFTVQTIRREAIPHGGIHRLRPISSTG